MGGTAEVTEGYKWEPAGLSEAALAPTITFSSFPHPLPLNLPLLFYFQGFCLVQGTVAPPAYPTPKLTPFHITMYTRVFIVHFHSRNIFG